MKTVQNPGQTQENPGTELKKKYWAKFCKKTGDETRTTSTTNTGTTPGPSGQNLGQISAQIRDKYNKTSVRKSGNRAVTEFSVHPYSANTKFKSVGSGLWGKDTRVRLNLLILVYKIIKVGRTHYLEELYWYIECVR